MEHTTISWLGQHIFVGLDVHKTSWVVAIVTEASAFKTFTQPPAPTVLVEYLQNHFPRATYHAVYEAGYCGFWICEAGATKQPEHFPVIARGATGVLCEVPKGSLCRRHPFGTGQSDRSLVIANVFCEAIYTRSDPDCFGSTDNVDPRNDASLKRDH